MKKAFLIVLVLGIIFSVAVAFESGRSTDVQLIPPPQGNLADTATTFSWRFAEAKSINPDGIPRTEIFLTLTRSTENKERLIDTVDGGCSDLGREGRGDDISNTGDVQCYGAGLGQRYRITQQADQTYIVERKLFEEALPDVSPQDYEWEVIEVFSL